MGPRMDPWGPGWTDMAKTGMAGPGQWWQSDGSPGATEWGRGHSSVALLTAGMVGRCPAES